MSSGTFGVRGSTITIHEDSAENVHAGQRKTKRDDMQGKAPANKRAALGTITNMTRIQPSRVAKQVSHCTRLILSQTQSQRQSLRLSLSF